MQCGTEPENTFLQSLSYLNTTDCILKFRRAIRRSAGNLPSSDSNFAQTVQQTNHLARATACGLRLLVIYSLGITVTMTETATVASLYQAP